MTSLARSSAVFWDRKDELWLAESVPKSYITGHCLAMKSISRQRVLASGSAGSAAAVFMPLAGNEFLPILLFRRYILQSLQVIKFNSHAFVLNNFFSYVAHMLLP